MKLLAVSAVMPRQFVNDRKIDAMAGTQMNVMKSTVGMPTMSAMVTLSRPVRSESRRLGRAGMAAAAPVAVPGRAEVCDGACPDIVVRIVRSNERGKRIPEVLDGL